MFKCADCGSVFENTSFVKERVCEDYYETIDVCPQCHSDQFDEVTECECCHDEVVPESKPLPICDDCERWHEKKMEAFVKESPLPKNIFWEWVRDCEERNW